MSNININKYHEYALYSMVFILSLIVYTAFQHHSIFMDCDSPWHIAAGDYIRSIGEVPLNDPWSFTAGDAQWYNLAWLYDVWISWLKDLAGIKGLVAINLLIAALIPCFLAKLCLMRGAALVPTLMASILAIVLVKVSVSVRPQLIAMLPACAALYVLYKYRVQESKQIWWLVPICLFWANVHGSYLVLYSIIGSFFLEALFAKDMQKVKTYVMVGVACLLVTMINPLGYEIFYGSWLSLSSKYSQEYVQEWQAATPGNSPQVFLCLLLLLMLQFKNHTKLPFADSLLVVFWLIMALKSTRHGIFFSMFFTPVFGLMLTNLFTGNKGRIGRIEQTMRQDLADQKSSKQLAAVVAVIVLLYVVPPTRNVIVFDDLYDEAKYPVNEISYLHENYSGSNVFNTYGYGGFIIYQTNGEIKPFLDGRVDTLFPEEVKKDYFDMLFFKPNWQEVSERYDVSLALFPNDNEDAVNAFRIAGWKVIHKGEVATIYQK